MKSKRVILASHISDLSGPTEALEKYLIKKSENLLSVLNPLAYCEEKVRVVKKYKRTELQEKFLPCDFRRISLVSWILDTLITLFYSFRFGHAQLFIACDPLMGFVGVILKRLNRVDRLVLYSIDWTERRFENKLINNIYYFLDSVVVSNSDYLWGISAAVVDVRLNQGYSEDRVFLVPVGVYQEEIRRPTDYDKNTLVFLGAFEKTKGIELVLDSWEAIREANSNARLVFIGKTPLGVVDVSYEERLKNLVGVTLLGVLPHKEVLKILGSYGVGLAPYSNDLYSISKYCDPSRVKDYIACGLPVLITDVPPIHRLVAKKRCGVVVNSYNTDSLLDGLKNIWDNYDAMRNNSVNYGKSLDWNKIFEDALNYV